MDEYKLEVCKEAQNILEQLIEGRALLHIHYSRNQIERDGYDLLYEWGFVKPSSPNKGAAANITPEGRAVAKYGVVKFIQDQEHREIETDYLTFTQLRNEVELSQVTLKDYINTKRLAWVAVFIALVALVLQALSAFNVFGGS